MAWRLCVSLGELLSVHTRLDPRIHPTSQKCFCRAMDRRSSPAMTAGMCFPVPGHNEKSKPLRPPMRAASRALSRGSSWHGVISHFSALIRGLRRHRLGGRGSRADGNRPDLCGLRVQPRTDDTTSLPEPGWLTLHDALRAPSSMSFRPEEGGRRGERSSNRMRPRTLKLGQARGHRLGWLPAKGPA